ncbi:helix-turn-helix transcriptional regulator [Parachitinimonas caeni]|uniref:Autoinducer binding domain-containing protein n=1 Tax=Parachitinimonas caeni TaxID=3031301 RepID=A0ABT7E2E2_9NEIS|nr:autoinducer binding domain-containing protein [Parachitinimonas caeni]MDK2126487.1 autoinducer binding domain-containing protein [Parachitinimonas caeni]
MRRNLIADLISAQRLDDLRRLILAFVRQRNHDYFCLAYGHRSDGIPSFTTHHFPTGWTGVVSPEIMASDPLVQAIATQRSNVPITWDDSLYAAAGKMHLWEYFKQFGLMSGIDFPLSRSHSRGGLLFGMIRGDSLPMNTELIDTIILGATLTHCLGALVTPLLDLQIFVSSLSPTEKELLYRVSDGCTEEQAGEICGLSRRQTVLLASQLRERAGVSSVQGAAALLLKSSMC